MAMIQVKAAAGAMRGRETETPGVTAFFGIPYAKPPVGELRWRSPVPAEPWPDVRDCLDFGWSCPQRSMGPAGGLPGGKQPVPPRPLRMNEDCLTLNVWTAADKPNLGLPVMVWYHGGGLQFGTSDDLIFDGEGLCPKGVVLVTVNYRLGVFGYFGHPELEAETAYHSSGNYGLQDQILALQWVHDNIAAFGGDPGNVTIFGCSGGGRSVQGISCSPLSKGLAHHGIVLSAGGLNPLYSLPYEDILRQGAEFVAFCGKASVEELRTIPAQELQQYYDAYGKQFNITGDGYYLPHTMDEQIRQAQQADLDYILSTMEHEIPSHAKDLPTLERFGAMTENLPSRAALFFQVCKPETDAQAADFFRLADAYDMKASQLAWAKLQANQPKKPVYLCTNIHPTPGSTMATHGADQIYIFHTLRTRNNPFTQVDERFSQTLMAYFVNFAKTGNPNGEGLSLWTPYTKESPLTMILCPDNCRMEDRSEPVLERTAKAYAEYKA